MIERDRKLLKYLEKFRVLSRDQVGKLVCNDTTKPSLTANRICKRLGRDGYLTIVPQFRDQQYVYMPSPPIIHQASTRMQHFMAITDIYIELGKPKHFEVEPVINADYRPDIYTTVDGRTVMVEVQRTRVATQRIQKKVDEFMRAYYREEHQACTLWICSEDVYEVKIQSEFNLLQGLAMGAAIV